MSIAPVPEPSPFASVEDGIEEIGPLMAGLRQERER